MPQALCTPNVAPNARFTLQFFRDERPKILIERSTAAEKSEIESNLFASMAKTVAARWKAIDSTQLEKYTRGALADAQRYREEMEAFNAKMVHETDSTNKVRLAKGKKSELRQEKIQQIPCDDTGGQFSSQCKPLQELVMAAPHHLQTPYIQHPSSLWQQQLGSSSYADSFQMYPFATGTTGSNDAQHSNVWHEMQSTDPMNPYLTQQQQYPQQLHDQQMQLQMQRQQLYCAMNPSSALPDLDRLIASQLQQSQQSFEYQNLEQPQQLTDPTRQQILLQYGQNLYQQQQQFQQDANGDDLAMYNNNSNL
jgi:hypothetical protein